MAWLVAAWPRPIQIVPLRRTPRACSYQTTNRLSVAACSVEARTLDRRGSLTALILSGVDLRWCEILAHHPAGIDLSGANLAGVI
jgi:hypothetical protein